MIDINSIAAQVKLNCNISDARYWGLYLPCGLLLRLRDLYRIENSLRPWEKIETRTIGDWIGEREQLWETFQTRDFQNIKINGKDYKPFDVKNINSILEDHGLLYGAGYGENFKPVFIFAEISDHFIAGRYKVLVAGREIARDLSTSLAMIQGNVILARKETANLFLWGKYDEMRARKCSGLLFRAFSEYGLTDEMCMQPSSNAIERILDDITSGEMLLYVHHELGEASQRRVLGRWWRELLLKLPYSRAELFLRGLKDILADTCRTGTLAYIINNRKAGSLYFYVALLGGFRKSIFPEIITAYEDFTKTGDWSLIEKARTAGYTKAKGFVKQLRAIYDSGMVSTEIIERQIII